MNSLMKAASVLAVSAIVVAKQAKAHENFFCQSSNDYYSKTSGGYA